MTTWSVVTWNMNLASTRVPETNWAFLDGVMEKESIDVALLCEAAMRPQTDTIYGSSGTSGRDFQRGWSTAIVSRHGPVKITMPLPSTTLASRAYISLSSPPDRGLGPRRR